MPQKMGEHEAALPKCLLARKLSPLRHTRNRSDSAPSRAIGAGLCLWSTVCWMGCSERVVRPLAWACVLLLLSACEKRVADVAERPVVIVSVPPLGYLVNRLAGDLVQTEVLLSPTASLHSPDLRTDQMRAIGRAQMVVQIGHPGLPFERTMLARLTADGGPLTVVSALDPTVAMPDDPHVWVSPVSVRAFMPRIASGLIELIPDQRSSFEGRLREFLAEIDAVDREIRAELTNLRTRRFYVFHPAWGSFARDYGLEQVSIEAEGKEPDPLQLSRLIEEARAERVGVLFVQPQFSRRSAEVVASEIGARVLSIDPLAYDWLTNIRQVADRLSEALH